MDALDCICVGSFGWRTDVGKTVGHAQQDLLQLCVWEVWAAPLDAVEQRRADGQLWVASGIRHLFKQLGEVIRTLGRAGNACEELVVQLLPAPQGTMATGAGCDC